MARFAFLAGPASVRSQRIEHECRFSPAYRDAGVTSDNAGARDAAEVGAQNGPRGPSAEE